MKIIKDKDYSYLKIVFFHGQITLVPLNGMCNQGFNTYV